MDIPNDLNKLLARLKEVTTDTSRTREACAPGPRPSAVEIDFFLSQYHFDADAEIEPIEISKDGLFEFYLFAVSNRLNDDVALLAMWPKPKASAEEAAWGLTRRHIGGAPVRDREGALVGMLTKGDLVNPEPAQWIRGEATVEDVE